MGLVREGALDADLAALLWLLLDGGLPLVVTGGTPERRAAMLTALEELPASAGRDADSERQVAHIGPNGLWGSLLRARIASLRPADRFRATAEAGSLRELMQWLESPEIGLADEEIRALGLVVVLDADGRMSAAHLLRPVERDGAGHLQRRPPAVLVSRDPRDSTLEHFSWAVTSELADRVDRSQADFEARQADRARLIDHLTTHPEVAADRMGLETHLATEPPRQPAPERPAARPPWPAPEGHRPH
ncbi:MAG: hypothetical protein M3472_01305 [Chloroflexota bacterium]|nr:hypothetical protein [Chloroflexota bacterium]